MRNLTLYIAISKLQFIYGIAYIIYDITGETYTLEKIGGKVYTDNLKCFVLNSPNQTYYICMNTQFAQFNLICKTLGSQK